MWVDFQCYWCGRIIGSGTEANVTAAYGPVHPSCWVAIRAEGVVNGLPRLALPAGIAEGSSGPSRVPLRAAEAAPGRKGRGAPARPGPLRGASRVQDGSGSHRAAS